jgi:hypothetical protein
MREHRIMGQVGSRSRRLVVIAVLMAPLAALGVLASPALAKSPTGDFAVFKQCPRTTKGVELCLYSETTGGLVTLNKQTVPINEEKKSPIILQGGITNAGESDEKFVGALNGETLSKTPQNVPGGLTGLINCTEIKGEGLLKPLAELAKAACKLVFENKTTGVSAVTELAKPASEIGISTNNLENAEGVALSLPLKIKLENTFLGSECYVGSSSSPVTLNLTTGLTSPAAPNTPIKGKVGEIRAKDEFEFIELIGNELVDNAFSAPQATGCGGIFSVVIDPLIDSKIGLASADGKNTAIQKNFIREATSEGVIKSEK